MEIDIAKNSSRPGRNSDESNEMAICLSSIHKRHCLLLLIA